MKFSTFHVPGSTKESITLIPTFLLLVAALTPSKPPKYKDHGSGELGTIRRVCPGCQHHDIYSFCCSDEVGVV